MVQADLLVLGASGRVGRLLRRHCAQQAEGRVLWQYRSPCDTPGSVLWTPGAPLPEARVVLVLSGITRGTPEALEENLALATNLAQAICRSGAEGALFASTMAVYGRTPPGGATEADLPDDPRPYGSAKLRAEQAFLDICAGHCRATALRFGNVVGADLLGDIVASAGPVTLDRFSDGGPRRSYLGIAQLARVIEALALRLARGETLPPVLNLAGRQPLDMADLLRAADIPFDWQPAPASAMEEAAMNCDLLASLIPHRPEEETPEALVRGWRVAP